MQHSIILETLLVLGMFFLVISLAQVWRLTQKVWWLETQVISIVLAIKNQANIQREKENKEDVYSTQM